MSAGFVTRWDLDKTYLRTDFDTLRELVHTALERPDRKRSVPGAAALLRELGAHGARVHILSGSPRQMRAKVEAKLRIDRVRWDVMTLKPNLSNLLRLRFSAMRDQLGYKLPALLEARVRDRSASPEVALTEALVGDDVEADAFVYSLYADVCGGAVDRAALARVLSAGRVYADQRRRALDAAAALAPEPAVERILIHLDRQSPPSRFQAYGSRVVPFHNYLQAALVLAEDGRLGAAGVLRVASELALEHRFDAEALARSYLDLQARGLSSGRLVSALTAAAEAEPTANPARASLLRACARMAEILVAPSGPRAPRPPSVDYAELATRHRGGRSRKLPRDLP